MSNGYSAVPNIIVGNATITGTLTVTGDGGIRIGSAAPFVRLFKDGAARLALSMNLGTDLSTRDVATQLAHDLAMGEPGLSPRFFEYNPLGTLLSSMLDRTLAQNYTNPTHTGTVTEDTIFTELIPGNTLGAHGRFITEAEIEGNVQAVGGSTIRLRLGGVVIWSRLVTATSNFWLRCVTRNIAATNLQYNIVQTFDNNNLFLGFRVVTAVDTTADNFLSLTIQSGAATDSWSFAGWHVGSAVQRNTTF